MVTSLQTVRRQLGYTATQVIDLLTRRADALHLLIETKASLKIKLSRWENGKEQPSDDSRRAPAVDREGRYAVERSPTLRSILDPHTPGAGS
jgi:hypothetical protein